MTWRREQVSIGDRFVHDENSASIYEVVAIIERPVVVLRSLSALRPGVGGIPDIHQVIDSDTFSYWRKVRLEGPR